ncbi:arsenate reductase family protein [Aquibacillus saliphilus]|uniref:arsenate reductase family protein n=1 Tax=Aquibacillus saliphilus TaxID=1909422 RepID=UPI001CEFE8CC|nr:arsenate reductase family protein [Aquibacillus saliphilus]
MTVTFYWYPKCGTCQKAKKWLEANDVEFRTVHMVEDTPTKEELQEIINVSNYPIKKFFNTSGKKYRDLGLKDKLKDATDSEMLDWLVSDGMLIKRPIITDGHNVSLGFKEEFFEQTWK